MKPKKHSRILRVIAVLLAIITGTASVAGGMLCIICYRTGMYSNKTRQEILEQINRQIQEHYEMTIIDNLDNPDFDKLNNTNLTYRVYRVGISSETKDDNDITYIEDAEHNITDGYTYSTADNLIYYDGVVANLLYRNAINIGGNESEIKTTEVESIVFNSFDQIFYYKTYDNEFFPVNTITIDSTWGKLLSDKSGAGKSTLIYHLKEEAGAYMCMNTNYAPLDTDKYIDWISVTMDGTKLYTPCIVKEIFDPKVSSKRSILYSFNVERDIRKEPNDNELFVVSDKSFSNTVRTTQGYYYLFQSVPKIHVERKINDYIISSWVASPLDMTKPDLFVHCTNLVNALYPYRNSILLGTLLGILLFIFMAILSCRFTLALSPKNEGTGDKPSLFARIPLLIYLLVTVGAFILCLMTLDVFFEEWINSPDGVLNIHLALALGNLVICFSICMMILLNIFERIRTKTLLRNTICYRIGRYFQKPLGKLHSTAKQSAKWICDFIVGHTSLFLRAVMGWIVLSIIEIIAMIVTNYDITSELFLFAIYKIFESIFIFFCVGQFNHIMKGSEQQAKGNLSEKLDTKRLFGPFRKHAENLNMINDGFQIAVQERLKNEHFKTELITNVSHDIKTPLTSIINYVDLLKQNNITPEEHDEYLEVLDRQSARLKKLIEDLIEASKASTGNLTVNLETCDLNILLTQTLGEFEEKMQANHLELIIRSSTNAANRNSQSDNGGAGNTDIIIEADSRHLWRIFDNLMTNICKYAQPNTRVYIDLEADTSETKVIFRNISRYRLEGDGEALLERFVRGDSSRNTEGNGLGLSIAKNLAELMKGQLSLSVDGDLFKVTITFPLYMERPEE